MPVRPVAIRVPSGGDGELGPGAFEAGAEAGDLAGGEVEGVKAALDILVGAFDGSARGGNEEVERFSVRLPGELGFEALVVGELFGFAAGGGDEEHLVLGRIFEAVRDGSRFEGELVAGGRDRELVDGERGTGR